MAVVRKSVPTRKLEIGKKIDNPIFDQSGKRLLERGAVLDDFEIKELISRGITQVYIMEGEPDEIPEGLENVHPSIRKTVEEKTKADKKKVAISEEVKQRVSAGIEYLFTNTNDEHLAESSANVSGELVDTVLNSDSVAMDIDMLKVSDEYTFKHSVDVAVMSLVIGKSMGLSAPEMRELGMAGLLHDLGKSRIPNEVLNKPGRLTDQEFALMKQHTLRGLQILRERGGFSPGVEYGVLQHHEKMNGRGYPQGLTRDKIHRYARIIAVADVYDALVTERPYKKGFTKSTAFEMLNAMGDDLDLEVMNHFKNTLIIYPVGSHHKLSNGETCRVLSNTEGYPTRPVLVGLKTGRIYDLGNDASLLIPENDINEQ